MAKLFEVKSLLVGLKACITGILTSLLMIGAYALGNFVKDKMPAVATLLVLVFAVFGLLVWGWLARTFWKWN
jgi:hypothetical protein